MAVKPEHTAYDAESGTFYVVTDATEPTHVCFAIDDLPELADELYFAVKRTRYYGTAFDNILDRLRGTTADTPGVPD